MVSRVNAPPDLRKAVGGFENTHGDKISYH